MTYSLYVSGVVAIQIFSAFMLMKEIDSPNAAFGAKFSLLTFAICNILDFSQAMTHIEYIMSSFSGYLFFILPSLAYLTLFIFL